MLSVQRPLSVLPVLRERKQAAKLAARAGHPLRCVVAALDAKRPGYVFDVDALCDAAGGVSAPMPRGSVADWLQAESAASDGCVERVRTGSYRARVERPALTAERAGGSPVRPHAGQAVATGLRALTAQGRPVASVRDIQAAIDAEGGGYSARAVSYGLDRLRSQGVVERLAVGKYRMVR